MAETFLYDLLKIVLTSVVTFFFANYWFNRNASAKVAIDAAQGAKTSHDNLVLEVIELSKDMALMKQSVAPISTAFQSVLAKEMTHMHTLIMDALLVKIGPPYTLTPEEEVQLATLLKQRMVDMGDEITEQEREAAEIFPIIIKRAKAEAQALREGKPIDVVAVTFDRSPHK